MPQPQEDVTDIAISVQGLPKKKPRSQKRRRNASAIKVRVDADELETIRQNASASGLSTPEFLRRLGKAYVPASTWDQVHVRELCAAAGDLGRLGGLLKLWLLAKRQAGEQDLDSIPIKSIDALWLDLQGTYHILKDKVLKL